MAQARRIYLYVMSFAGLITTLAGTAGLLALIVVTVLLPSPTLGSAEDVRQRTSLYLAEIIIGFPVWLGHWLWGERLASRASEERQSFMRRLFLAAVFATTAVVALYGLCGFLIYAFTWPGGELSQPSWQAGIQSGFNFLVYGAAWLGYARLGQKQESIDRDQTHDLAVYVLSGFALGFLLLGTGQAVAELVREALTGQAEPRRIMLAGPGGPAWMVWGAIAAWIVSGAVVWSAIWLYDLRRGKRRMWRIIYLYVVLIVTVPTALGGSAYGLYELLRRGFGYRAGLGEWDFLQVALPLVIAAGAGWWFHWAALRRQAEFSPEVTGNGSEAKATEAIPWPRRPAIALLAFLGLAAIVPAVIALLWVGFDFAFNTAGALSGVGWWRDRTSLALAAGVCGLAVWLPMWARLEAAAEASPQRERFAMTRRIYLGVIVLAGALAALGFACALLWLLIRLLLGDALTPSVLSSAFKYLVSGAVLAAVAAYHAQIFRRDWRWSSAERPRTHLLVLLEPGAEAALESLKQEGRADVRVLGHVRQAEAGTTVGLADVVDAAKKQDTESELVILGPSRGVVYPYEE